jgi:hypothetical protein
MPDMPVTPPGPPVAPWDVGPPAPPTRGRRWLKLAVGVGAAAGVAVGATALAQAATSSGGAKNGDATVTASSSPSTTTTVPGRPHGFGGPGRVRGGFGAGGFGGPGAFAGPGLGAGLIHGEFTIKGPNGYETLSERTGTVSDVTDTSGSTWSLTVKSADGTSGTFTVDSGTSVNGGELGIGSVKAGDTVSVTAVVSGGTSTAKSVTDQTVLKANGGTWQPKLSTPGPMGGPASPGSSSSTQGTTAPV